MFSFFYEYFDLCEKKKIDHFIGNILNVNFIDDRYFQSNEDIMRTAKSSNVFVGLTHIFSFYIHIIITYTYIHEVQFVRRVQRLVILYVWLYRGAWNTGQFHSYSIATERTRGWCWLTKYVGVYYSFIGLFSLSFSHFLSHFINLLTKVVVSYSSLNIILRKNWDYIYFFLAITAHIIFAKSKN